MHGICRVLPVLRDRVLEMPLRLFCEATRGAAATLPGLTLCRRVRRLLALAASGQDSKAQELRIEVELYASSRFRNCDC